MKVNGFACDQCEKFFEDNSDFFTVNRRDLIVEVCCTACLRKMAGELVAAESQATGAKPGVTGRPAVPSEKAINAAQARVRMNGSQGISGGSTPNDEPCDACGRIIDTRQGLAAHRRKAHGLLGLPGSPDRPSRAKDTNVESTT